MSGFAFSFSGDDIEFIKQSSGDSDSISQPLTSLSKNKFSQMYAQTLHTSAFPIAGQELLPAQLHSLDAMLAEMPSKIAYKSLVIPLIDGTSAVIPRRELWDVRVQLMAEDDDENLGNLGNNDIKSGIYEGGFKSWESSSDLVKVLYQRSANRKKGPSLILELGCGTALPSLFEFQQQLRRGNQSGAEGELNLGLADYNPTVLQLVTLPNFILSWAQVLHGLTYDEGELEIDEALIMEFKSSLELYNVSISFFSGAWGSDFIHVVEERLDLKTSDFLLLGAETIYSPFALRNFAGIVLNLLESASGNAQNSALVAAKEIYFGVGGTMEDFCDIIRVTGATTELIYEETGGVSRVIVEVKPPSEWLVY